MQTSVLQTQVRCEFDSIFHIFQWLFLMECINYKMSKKYIEPYRRLSLLGEGVSGQAYLVSSKADGSLWVMKRISLRCKTPDFKQSIKQEAVIHRTLSHPNIIKFKEVYYTPTDKMCIIMQYAQKGDLDSFIENQTALLPQTTILNIFSQICNGVNALHNAHIMHRDLKGANIFLTKDDVVKVGDFGISKPLDMTDMACKSLAGTPYYLAPQMVEGKPYTIKADIWAMGVILYRLCTFKMPFDAHNMPSLALKILKGVYQPIRGYSEDIKKLCKDMLQRNASSRPSCEEIMNRSMFSSFYSSKKKQQKITSKEKNKKLNPIYYIEERENQFKKQKYQQNSLCFKKVTSCQNFILNPNNPKQKSIINSAQFHKIKKQQYHFAEQKGSFIEESHVKMSAKNQQCVRDDALNSVKEQIISKEKNSFLQQYSGQESKNANQSIMKLQTYQLIQKQKNSPKQQTNVNKYLSLKYSLKNQLTKKFYSMESSKQNLKIIQQFQIARKQFYFNRLVKDFVEQSKDNIEKIIIKVNSESIFLIQKQLASYVGTQSYKQTYLLVQQYILNRENILQNESQQEKHIKAKPQVNQKHIFNLLCEIIPNIDLKILQTIYKLILIKQYKNIPNLLKMI